MLTGLPSRTTQFLKMRMPRAIYWMLLLLPALACATSLRRQRHPDEGYLQTNLSHMRIEDLIRNQQAINAIGRSRNIISDAMPKSDETPTSLHETHQVSTTSLLNGYYVTAVYNDSECSTVMSAVAYELNTCIDYGNFFLKSAATADAESETKYSNNLCTAKESLSSYIDYTASCATISRKQSTLTLINSNGVSPSSLPMMSIRFVSPSLLRFDP